MNPLYVADAYKISHRAQYPEKTNLVYSNFTPRSNKYASGNEEGVVVFGIQAFIKKYLVEYFEKNFFSMPLENVKKSFIRRITAYFGQEPDTKHLEELHALGYLPIVIKALPEGSICPFKVPVLTIQNTKSDFFWITNFLETLMSTELWQPMTSATIANEYKKILTRWANKTCDNHEHLPFQAHDFSMRGMAGLDAAMASSAAHLLSFAGSDTIPAIDYLEEYYSADCEKELIGVSVPATEHSVMSMGTKDDEIGTFKRLITKIYPSGIISIVSDTWNIWKVLIEYIPALKDEIMARNGKVVIRPDTGIPEDIICGDIEIIDYADQCSDLEEVKSWAVEHLSDKVGDETPHGEYGEEEPFGIFCFKNKNYKITADIEWNRHDKQYYYIDDSRLHSCEEVELLPSQKGVIELLWDTFGGTINSKGYKVLDPHIGAIYGDSITLKRADEICKRLEAKGFASSNIVFGIGSYTYQYNTRDTYGFAMKATYGEVDGVGREIYKDPITDDGMKKSAKGLLRVEEKEGKYILYDQQTWEQEKSGELKTVFNDGKIYNETNFNEIKNRLLSQ